MICITSTTIVCFNRCAVSIGYIYYQYVLMDAWDVEGHMANTVLNTRIAEYERTTTTNRIH